jgi:dTDP-4-dehydrorhamnose 3,5-epimerase
MKIIQTKINDLVIIEPNVYKDARGFFLESWNKKNFKNLTNLEINFIQDNQSRSSKDVIRGLHYQLLKPQGKLVSVIRGEVLDVVVDLRKSSSTFGNHLTINLNDHNFRSLWVPPGCAHGFLVLSEYADFIYKVTEYYSPKDEHCIIWNDPDLNIDWELKGTKPIISKKDLQGKCLKDAPIYE